MKAKEIRKSAIDIIEFGIDRLAVNNLDIKTLKEDAIRNKIEIIFASGIGVITDKEVSYYLKVNYKVLEARESMID